MLLILKLGLFCHTEKYNEEFYNNYKECKPCNPERVLKTCYDNKDGILQKRRDKYARFKDLDISLKGLEEKFSIKNSENN